MREEYLPRIPGYVIKKELGEGGMAKIFLAVQEHLEREVAIKVLKPFLIKEGQSLKRFQHEAQTASKLSHPNIITIFDVDHHGDTHYIVMEYLKESLRTRMKAREKLPPEEALEIIKKLGDALFTAHSRGVIHRDIKPDNVMFRPDGDPVLLDFGIARALDLDTRLTITGMSVGTPHYMSPEQCRGEELDGRSDIYSLGILLFELLTGKVPYKADNALGIIYHHTHSPVPQLPEEYSGYQPLLDSLLAKERETRIRDGAQVVERIEMMGKGYLPGGQETDEPGVQPLPGPHKGKTVWMWIFIIAVLLGVLGYFIRGPALKKTPVNFLEPPESKSWPEWLAKKPGILTSDRGSEYGFNRDLELAKKYFGEGKYDNALASLDDAKKYGDTREIEALESEIKERLEETGRDEAYRKSIDLAIRYYRAGEYDSGLEALARAKTYKRGVEILELEKKIREKQGDENYQRNYKEAVQAIAAGELDRALTFIQRARSIRNASELDQLAKEVKAKQEVARIGTVNFVDLSRESVAGLNTRLQKLEILNLGEEITAGGEIQLNLSIDETGKVSVSRLDDSRIIVSPPDRKEQVLGRILQKINGISVDPLEDETGKPLRVINWRKIFNLGTFQGTLFLY